MGWAAWESCVMVVPEAHNSNSNRGKWQAHVGVLDG
jgi:hypothetical protein